MKKVISILLFLIIGISTANAKVGFKTDRIKSEFKELKYVNEYLYNIIMVTDLATDYLYKKGLVITEVYRSQKEQSMYYKDKRQFRSPHQDWFAVDIRSRNFTKKETKRIVKILNDNFNKKNTYKTTALYHDVGLGKHIHVQFKEMGK